MAEFIREQIAFSHKNALLEYQLLWLTECTVPALDLNPESPHPSFEVFFHCILLCISHLLLAVSKWPT